MSRPAPDIVEPGRVHPASIAVHVFGSPLVAVAAGWLLLPEAIVPIDRAVLLAGMLGFAVCCLVLAFFSWRRLVYGFDADGDFRMHRGLLLQRDHRLALSRLQSVEVVAPLPARAVGLASVRIEVAGETAVVEFLPRAQARALREEVLARAGGADRTPARPVPEVPLAQVRAQDLFVSLLMRSSTMIAVTVIAVATLLIIWRGGFGGLLLVGTSLLVPLGSVSRQFASYYGFALSRSADGAQIRAGLLATRRWTVPPGRVHAVEISQPVLWRRRDWVRVTVNTAGAGPDEDYRASVPLVLLPVARREDALRIVDLLLPRWSLDGVQFEPAPDAARRRAWIQHRQLGVAVTPDLFIARRGRLVRRTSAVAHGHVQSVRVVQGPWQRALGLASVRADIVRGDVQVVALHRGAAGARRIADAEAVLARRARAQAAPQRWLAEGGGRQP